MHAGEEPTVDVAAGLEAASNFVSHVQEHCIAAFRNNVLRALESKRDAINAIDLHLGERRKAKAEYVESLVVTYSHIFRLIHVPLSQILTKLRLLVLDQKVRLLRAETPKAAGAEDGGQRDVLIKQGKARTQLRKAEGRPTGPPRRFRSTDGAVRKGRFALRVCPCWRFGCGSYLV